MKAFAVVFAVFIVLMKVFGDKMVAGEVTLDLDFVKLHLAQQYGGISGLALNHIDVVLITGCVCCIVIRYGIRYLRGILAPVKEGRPFDGDVSANMKKFGWVILTGGAAVQVLGVVYRMLLARTLPMDEILSSSVIEKVEYVFTLDLNFVLVGCLILLLSRIFEYGHQLQQESDETL